MAAASAGANNALDTTPGKGNFQRLTRLLIAGGTSVLREVFDSIHAPTTLPTVLASSSVKTKLSRARLTKPQWDSLYPAPGCHGKSSDFDITLLFKLLRTICSLPSPSSGWDDLPSATEQSVCDDLARVKFYRNDVYGHVSEAMEIGDDDFNDLWVEISGALIRLAHSVNVKKKQEWQQAIAKLHNDPLTPEDERNTEELKAWYRSDFDTKEMLDQVSKKMNRKLEHIHEKMEQIDKKLEQPEASASLTIFIKGDIAVGMDGISLPAPSVDEIMRTVAGAYLKSSPLRSLEDCNTFRMFMQDVRKPFIVNEEVLEGFWEDYFSGALNEAVQRCLVTALSKYNEGEPHRNCIAELTEMNELRGCNRTDSTTVPQTESLNNSFHSKLASIKTVEGDPKMSGVQESDESPEGHLPQEYSDTSIVDFFEALSELHEPTKDVLREWFSNRQQSIFQLQQFAEFLHKKCRRRNSTTIDMATIPWVCSSAVEVLTSLFKLEANFIVALLSSLGVLPYGLEEYNSFKHEIAELIRVLDEDREASETLRESFERMDQFFECNSELIYRNIKNRRFMEGFGIEGIPEMFPDHCESPEDHQDTRDVATASFLETLGAGVTVCEIEASRFRDVRTMFNTLLSVAQHFFVLYNETCPVLLPDVWSIVLDKIREIQAELISSSPGSYCSEEEVPDLASQYVKSKLFEILRDHAQPAEPDTED